MAEVAMVQQMSITSHHLDGVVTVTLLSLMTINKSIHMTVHYGPNQYYDIHILHAEAHCTSRSVGISVLGTPFCLCWDGKICDHVLVIY